MTMAIDFGGSATSTTKDFSHLPKAWTPLGKDRYKTTPTKTLKSFAT